MTWWYPYSCNLLGQPSAVGAASNIRAQCVPLSPDNAEGELRPLWPTGTLSYLYSGYYKTPFVYNIGNFSSLTRKPIISWFRRPTSGNLVYIWHYQPFAWNGTPPEVFAAVLLQMGMTTDYIETAAFTNAHGRYYAVSGDEPWVASAGHTTHNSRQIYCWRRVGQRVIVLLLEIARHGRDMYFVNEAGKIDVSSFTSPEEVVAALDLRDGVIGDVDWVWTSDLIFNTVRATWGHGFNASGAYDNKPDESSYTVSEEPTLDSYIGNKYVHEAVNAASVAKFGALVLGDSKRATNRGGSPREMVVSHYPLYLDPGATDAGWAAGQGGMQHVVYWLASDSKERRMVTLTQDFRALDWGIGARVDNVAVTDDGQTIPACWCIERTYDFDRLTVTSVLMEQPPNT